MGEAALGATTLTVRLNMVAVLPMLGLGQGVSVLVGVAVMVAVNWRLGAPEVAHVVNDAQAKVFVVGEEFVPILDQIESSIGALERQSELATEEQEQAALTDRGIALATTKADQQEAIAEPAADEAEGSDEPDTPHAA